MSLYSDGLAMLAAGSSVVGPYPPPIVVTNVSPPPSNLEVAGVIVGIGLLIGFGVLYNRWAYDDWTCMFKNCVQTSSKRR